MTGKRGPLIEARGLTKRYGNGPNNRFHFAMTLV